MPTVKSKTTTTTTTTLSRESVSLDKATMDAISEWVEVKDTIKALTERKEALASHIEAMLDGKEVGLDPKTGKVRIEVSNRERTTVDAKALAEAFPEAYEATKRTTAYTVLIAK